MFHYAAVKQHWKLDLDERTCMVCIGIAAMAVGGIAIDAMFDSVEGPIEQPPVHPRCRCSLEMRTNLDLVTVPGTAIAEAMQ